MVYKTLKRGSSAIHSRNCFYCKSLTYFFYGFEAAKCIGRGKILELGKMQRLSTQNKTNKPATSNSSILTPNVKMRRFRYGEGDTFELIL